MGWLELEWNVKVRVGVLCVCECAGFSGWVSAGECMCMSFFEFAFLRFEEGWEFPFIFLGFFLNVLAIFVSAIF